MREEEKTGIYCQGQKDDLGGITPREKRISTTDILLSRCSAPSPTISVIFHREGVK